MIESKYIEEIRASLQVGRIGIWSFDILNNVIRGNTVIADIFGQDHQQTANGLPLETFTAVIHPEDQDRVSQLIEEAITHATPYEAEYRIAKDGQRYIWVLARGQVEVDEQGQAVSFPGALMDITLRKEVELKLKEERIRYEAIFNAPLDAILITNKSGYLVEVNQAACDMHQYTYDELVGSPLTKIVAPESHELLKKALGALLAGENFQTPAKHIRKDGKRIEVESVGSDFHYRGQQMMLGVIRNVTERNQTRQKLHYSNALKESIMDSSSDCVKILELDGALIDMNVPGQRLLELDDFSLLQGKNLVDFWGESDRLVVLEAIDAAIKGGTGTFVGFCPTFKQTPKWWDVRISPICDKQGEPTHLLAISRDITERKVKEQQKDDFLVIASHELRTPVTSVKGYIQLLERSLRNEGNQHAADQLKKVDQQIDKLTTLINNLLDVNNFESGKVVIEKKIFDFDQLVTEVVDNMQLLTKQHLIKEGKSQHSVLGDRNRIGQVVTNFITNAIKYSPRIDRIIIRTQILPDHIQFSVQDFGIGIPESEQGKIFERFYRSANPNNRAPGVGLGLFISNEIIQRHQGEIWVESDPEIGSTFSFTLPKAPPSETATQ